MSKKLKVEKKTFDDAEYQRIKALKKKQQENPGADEPKPIKPKIFKSDVIKQVCTTYSYAPRVIERDAQLAIQAVNNIR